MATTHISEAEAASDFAGLMNRVRSGEEIVIESETQPEVLLRPAILRRSISETIARAEASSKALGYTPAVDAEFVADMNEIIRS